MGYYLQVPENKGKTEQIISLMNAVEIPKPANGVEVCSSKDVLVCVLIGLHWDAAGICFSQSEFREFADQEDSRTKRWLLVPRDQVLKQHPNIMLQY